VVVIVRRDDGRETTVKGNNGSGWSFDGVVFWLGGRQNGDAIEWWEEWMGVRRSGEGSLWWWCGFNVSVSARKGRRQDKALPENKAEIASSSWLSGKKA
jgi:hypothetical protein